MVKGRVVPPKYLFHVPTQIENPYTLIEQSAHLVLLMIFSLLSNVASYAAFLKYFHL